MLESTPALLGGIALFSSLLAAALVIYLLVNRRAERRRSAISEPSASPDAHKAQPADTSPGASRSARVAPPKAHSLFVIFSSPGPETQQALVGWLRQIEARYDSVLEVYSVAGKQPANPIRIANAFLPGTLPDVLAPQPAAEGKAPLRGLSLLVKPALRRSRNQQMHLFVELAHQLEALGGEVLDAERQPASESTYAAIIGDAGS